METRLTLSYRDYLLIALIMLVSIFSRVIPHPPNFTAEIALTLYIGYKIPQKFSWLVVLAIALISDSILNWKMNYPLFGTWSYFTYSALIAICFIGNQSFFRNQKFKFLWVSLFTSFGYWIWTNLGVWLVSGLYSHTLYGLLMCYNLAIPFLKNSLLSSLMWALLITACEKNTVKKNLCLR